MKTLTLAILIFILPVLFCGCLLTGSEAQGKLAILESQVANLKAQAERAVVELKSNGFSPAAFQQLVDSLAAVNQVSAQIRDLKSQAGSSADWLSIIIAIVSGLAGYPIMRAGRLTFSNSAIPKTE